MGKEVKKKVISDDLEIIDIFRVFFKQKEKLWSWQNRENPNDPKIVHFIHIKKVDIIKKIIIISPLVKEGLHFTKKEELFIYSKRKGMAIKVTPQEVDPSFLIFRMPERINLVGERFAAKLSIVEKENEDEHIHERSAPRKKTPGEQFISIEKEVDEDKKVSIVYGLYDISPGGMGIQAKDPGEFTKGQLITVTNLNGKNLSRPIKGKVMSIRHMIEDDQFKIGVQFIDS